MIVTLDIVIPTYRDGPWLKELLDCIMVQDLSRVRTFVVFDLDEEPVLDSVYETIPGLSLIRARRGIGAARNAGAALGCGEWILFLDADGLLPERFLADLKELIEKDQPEAATFSFYADSFALLMRLGTRVCWWYLRLAGAFGKAALPGFATLVRRNVYDAIGGYRNDLGISEDFVFSDDLLKMGCRIKLYSHPWLIYSVRRFDLPFFRAFALFWKYLIIDLDRRLCGRRILVGDIDYKFGAHRPPGGRRRPTDLGVAGMSPRIRRRPRGRFGD